MPIDQGMQVTIRYDTSAKKNTTNITKKNRTNISEKNLMNIPIKNTANKFTILCLPVSMYIYN